VTANTPTTATIVITTIGTTSTNTASASKNEIVTDTLEHPYFLNFSTTAEYKLLKLFRSTRCPLLDEKLS
jgi:hypothetical protein